MKSQCSEPECDRVVKGRGLCSKHSARVRFAENPERIKANNARWRSRNKEKVLAANREWLAANPERAAEFNRKSYLKRKYGITPETKLARLAGQGFKCANPGCGRTEPGGNGVWHTDHDHATGSLRGELCHGCNTSLGQLAESEQRIRGLVEYLQQYKEEAWKL